MTFSKNFIAFGIILALFPYLKVPVANFDTAPYALIFFTCILFKIELISILIYIYIY